MADPKDEVVDDLDVEEGGASSDPYDDADVKQDDEAGDR